MIIVLVVYGVSSVNTNVSQKDLIRSHYCSNFKVLEKSNFFIL